MQAKLSCLEIASGCETVYNFEVHELHNFLVGLGGLIAHNACFNIVSKRLKKLGVGGSHKVPPRKKSITSPDALIPQLINGGASHVGGASIAKKGGKGNFPGPDKTSLYKKNVTK